MKSGSKTVALLVLALLTLTVALSGCSGDRGAVPEDGNGPSAADDLTEPDALPPTGEPIFGGEIVVGIAQDLDSSLDPHEMAAAGTAGTREVMFNVFEGLVRPNPDGELIPAVAESFVMDGSIYTFTLREGVRFHNGELVTVEDIVYSIERGADEERVSVPVSALSVVTRVEAMDQRTVEIEIEEPDNEFLAHLTLAIIPRNHDDHGRNPVGTGPFRFVSYSPQESLVLERFEDYWGKPAYLDRVTFRIYGSADVLVMALNAGAIDMASHLTVDMVNQLSRDFYALEGPMSLVQALYLNHAVEPLDNLLVRQAMNYAVDIGEIMDVLADGRGHPTGSSIHPAFSRYFNEELLDLYPHDPGRAKALLEQAGFPDGFDLTITVAGNYTPHVITAEVLVEQLRAVGIRAAIRLVEWTYWVSEVHTNRQFESTVIGIAARDLTARSMLERFVSDNRRNFINFNSPVYDAVFLEAQATTDDAQRIALYRELQAILAREAANVYLQDLVNMVAVNVRLAGFQFYPIYVMNLATVHFVAE